MAAFVRRHSQKCRRPSRYQERRFIGRGRAGRRAWISLYGLVPGTGQAMLAAQRAEESTARQALPGRTDQAVALRRRRLVIQWFRRPFRRTRWPRSTAWLEDARERRVLGADVEIDIDADRRDQHPHPHPTASSPTCAQRQFRPGRPGRRAVQPVSARARHRRAVARGRHRGAHRRIPRLGHARDARRRSRRTCRRRSTSASRCSPARPKAASTTVLREPRAGTLKPLYNYMDDLPALEGAPTPILPGDSACATHPATSDELRRRAAAARSSARSAPSSTCRAASRATARRRRRDDHPRRTARRASTGSSSPTTISPATRTGRAIFDRIIELREEDEHGRALHHPGRHAVPPDPEFHREGEARRRDARVHRAGEHQSRTICWRPRSGRTRSPNTARCCWPGRRPAS